MFNKKSWKKRMEAELATVNEQLVYEKDMRKKLIIGVGVTAFSGLLGISVCSHKIKKLEDEDARLRQIEILSCEIEDLKKDMSGMKKFRKKMCKANEAAEEGNATEENTQ